MTKKGLSFILPHLLTLRGSEATFFRVGRGFIDLRRFSPAFSGMLLIAMFALLDTAFQSAFANSTTSAVIFNGPEQDFSLTISFNGTLTVNGTGQLKDVLPFGGDVDFAIDDSSPVVLQETTFASDPDGTATIGYDKVTANDKMLADLDVDFRNGADWSFQFDPTDIDVDFDIIGTQTLRFEILGAITQFDFLQDPGAVPATPGYSAPGTAETTLEGTISAAFQDVALGTDIDLGEVAGLNESSSSDLDLFGGMTLTSLGGLFPRDMLAELDLNLPISLTFPVDLEGTANESNDDFQLNMNYSLTGSVTLSNLLYHLEDTVAGALVPEPASLALFLFGAFQVLLRRRYGT